MVEQTLAIIKPDAVKSHHIGAIITMIEKQGFKINAMRMLTLTQAQAEEFYAIHKQRPFFGELVSFMISGPVVAMILEKENAIAEWRLLMGDTNPAKAASGSVRFLFGTSIGENATHGSDAVQTAHTEVEYFKKLL